MKYDVIVSSVHDRGDLLERTLRSMIAQLDVMPSCIIVHEDVRASQPFVEKRTERIVAAIEGESGVPVQFIRTQPGGGLARGMVRLLSAASTEFVFYTQEDFDFVRPVPVSMALGIMSEYSLNQVRFNKRKTMRIKGEDRPKHEQWRKVEVKLGGQVFCISDRWYHQASLWRRELSLDGYRTLVDAARPGTIVERCEDKFDHWINSTIGGGCSSVDGHQDARRERCRTFIWGAVAEPAFVRHTGGDRRSQGWG